ncbi:hypothetical protein C8F04DRAFT_29181 [Mycena alexandri]|uniref:Uncharacterized protein n=1 Tax=Mycena alexandri TaxID=1745969 RepID=A0AAD6X8I7_9AGAR|nr:hypothetical protein C8F04DRAFT_29181 [Mycena alexandri]
MAAVSALSILGKWLTTLEWPVESAGTEHFCMRKIGCLYYVSQFEGHGSNSPEIWEAAKLLLSLQFHDQYATELSGRGSAQVSAMPTASASTIIALVIHPLGCRHGLWIAARITRVAMHSPTESAHDGPGLGTDTGRLFP